MQDAASPLAMLAGLMDEWRRVVDPMLWTARYTPPARHITLEEGEVEYTTCARHHTIVVAALEDMESHNAQIVLKTVELTTFAWVAEQALSFVKSPARTRPSTSDSSAREEWGEKEASPHPKEEKAFYSVPDDIGSRPGPYTPNPKLPTRKYPEPRHPEPENRNPAFYSVPDDC